MQSPTAARRPKLPPGITACLFDLDGVLTHTATAHASAWKETFDAFLRERSQRTGEVFRPFELPADYLTYVDGKLRLDGVRSFLESRGIVLPEGTADDGPDAPTVHGIGRRKNEMLLEVLRQRGVEVYEGSVHFVEAVRRASLPCAVVSASKNCKAVLQAANMESLFDVRVDGAVAAVRNLRGKPEPDMFLAAAADLGITPAQGAVFEDAVAGVAAGRAGRFGYVVGVDRGANGEALLAAGADIVVTDLAELMETA